MGDKTEFEAALTGLALTVAELDRLSVAGVVRVPMPSRPLWGYQYYLAVELRHMSQYFGNEADGRVSISKHVLPRY